MSPPGLMATHATGGFTSAETLSNHAHRLLLDSGGSTICTGSQIRR
jgi:hypothetical protein